MINTDAPINTIEEDKLNRENFVDSLANAIIKRSTDDSLCIGLYGPWGSGKSSLLNLLLERIRGRDNEITIVRFNSWLFSNPEQLMLQFFLQVSEELQIKGSRQEKLYKEIDKYADLLMPLKLIPTAGKFVEAGIDAAKIISQNELSKKQSIQVQKKKIDEALREDNIRLVIAIDDIDRLTNEEIVSIFQLVKSLADFPRTTYILAFDYDVVINALKGVQFGDGKEYLEKIVQIPFEIPFPDINDIYDILFSKLNAIVGDVEENSFDRRQWSLIFEYGIKPYLRTIRDVNRFVNLFSLKYELLKEEIDIVDLLSVTCLQVFEPVLYSKLPWMKNTLVGTNLSLAFSRESDRKEQIKSYINEMLNESNIENITACKYILSRLFPSISTAFNTGGIHDSNADLFAKHHIAASDCFDRYFALSLEKDAIPNSVINQFLLDLNTHELERTIFEFYQLGKVVHLYTHVYRYLNSTKSKQIDSNRAKTLLAVMIRVFASLEVEDNNLWTGPSFEMLFRGCVEKLLTLVVKEDRYSLLEGLYKDKKVELYTMSIVQQSIESADNNETDNQIFTVDEISALRDIYINKAVDEIEGNKWVDKYKGFKFWRVFEILEENTATNCKEQLASSDLALAKIVGESMRHSYSSSKFWSLDPHYLSSFIDVESAYQRMSSFVFTSEFTFLRKGEQEDIVGFLLCFEHGITIDNDFEKIDEEAIRVRMKAIEKESRD